MATDAPPKKPNAGAGHYARGAFKRTSTVVGIRVPAAEALRLQEDKTRKKNWKRWGPYLSERQWATVREDYSADGSWYGDQASEPLHINCKQVNLSMNFPLQLGLLST